MDQKKLDDFFTNMMDELGIRQPDKKDMADAKLAKDLWGTYSALTEVGFSDDQAFTIIMAMVTGASKR